MGALEQYQGRDDVAAALIRNLDAEADKYRAEQAHQLVETKRAELMVESIGFDVDRDRFAREAESQQDYHFRTLPFHAPITEDTVRKAIVQLNTWHRLDTGNPIEVIFTSGGGSLVDGLALFDHIRHIVHQGTPVTTGCLGLAASMAGILLQAGSTRYMGAEAWLMVHEVEYAAQGKFGEILDMTKWVEAAQNRVWKVFAEKSTLSAEEIEQRAHRKEWWIDSTEAKALGFIDEIR